MPRDHQPRRRSELSDRPAHLKNMSSTSDAVVIGGGHNGLVCAAYLAAAGLKVTVLERRQRRRRRGGDGGVFPGFRNSVASYTVSLLNPKVIRDLDLQRARPEDRRARRSQNFLPLPDGRYLKTGAGPHQGRGREVLDPRRRAARRVSASGSMRSPMCCAALVLETPPDALASGWRARCRNCSRPRARAAASAGSTRRCGAN